ncbi:hypothetical protein F511_41568 [Dorcoceras hygrometricum]|uniref:Uncharacterized protein n=1 Tax=Dorcoceras hygrometricum TaxID=472368 RepID=A0A2Z7C3B5_9LAMI|nr:hypothetical protein F511_41568 [Dorcoceras hygrometricum]
MAESFFVNTLQVDFESVLAMEHNGMVRIFKSLEDTWLKGFLEASNSVYEGAVTEFFVNAKVIAGTIFSFVANRKMVITKDMFTVAFGLPTEGIIFLAPSKKKEMKMEFRLVHDIVAKELCEKAGSFDVVTSEKFDLMVAITAGLKTTLALETRAGDESLACGPEGHVKTTPEQAERIDGSDSNGVEHEGLRARKFTDGCPEGTTYEIEDLVEHVERTEQEERSNQFEKEIAINEADIVMRSGATASTLPLISRQSTSRGTLPTGNSGKREHAECQLRVYDQWHRFRTGYRLDKISSMEFLTDFAKVENKLLPWAEMDKVSELLQRRDPIWYKLVELLLQEAVAKH